jgi:hypothetical protein
MTGHQLDPSPSTTVDVFSCDLPPVLTVDPGDTIMLTPGQSGGPSFVLVAGHERRSQPVADFHG